MLERIIMKKVPVYAYYFPNWHVDSRNEAWHGKGWTEWNVIKCAHPRFPGHDQPKVPLWGYLDEADPKVMEKKIDAALSHGIDGFLWDTYWYSDGGFRYRALEEGFFGARNNEKCKFAIHWCNHAATLSHPGSFHQPWHAVTNDLLSKEEVLKGFDYFIENYFTKPNYIRINDRLLFIIYDPAPFIKGVGGIKEARETLEEVRTRVKNAGLGDIMFAVDIRCCEAYQRGDKKALNEFFESVGFEAATHYTWDPEDHPDKEVITLSKEKYAENGVKLFAYDSEICDYSVNPVVSSGWDSSPRTVQSDIYIRKGYPFTRIVDGRDPALFEKTLRCVKEFTESEAFHGDFITISSWNEWGEGNYIEPDETHGYAFLEAVKRVFKD